MSSKSVSSRSKKIVKTGQNSWREEYSLPIGTLYPNGTKDELRPSYRGSNYIIKSLLEIRRDENINEEFRQTIVWNHEGECVGIHESYY